MFQRNQNIVRHHWERKPGDIAVRYDAADLPGIIRKGLIVEPGTNAVLVVRGENQGVMPPGEYALENTLQRFGDWLTSGIPDRSTISLVDITPLDLEFNFGGCLTSDPLPIGLTLRMRVAIGNTDEEINKFVFNVLKEQHQFTAQDLRTTLNPEVYQVVDSWLRGHTLDQLVNESIRKAQLELAVEEAIRMPLAQLGIKFLQIRTVELNLEPYDEVQGLRAKTKLMLFQAEADSAYQDAVVQENERRDRAEKQARQRLAEIEKEKDLEALAAETRKIEIEEQRIDLMQRMRQAMLSDKMNEVRSEADFDVFLQGQNRQKLLSEKEKNDLLRTWKEQGEDHERARVFTSAKLDIDQKAELQILNLRLQSGMDRERLDNEIALARKKADYEFELKQKSIEGEFLLERERIKLQHDRDQAEAEHARLKMTIDQETRKATFQSDMEEAIGGLDLLQKMKDVRAQEKEVNQRIDRIDMEERYRIQRTHDLELKRFDLEAELQRWELNQKQRLADQAHQVNVMEMMKGLGTEAIIASVGGEQGDRIVELKKAELNAASQGDLNKAKLEYLQTIHEKENQLNERLYNEEKQRLERERLDYEKRVQDQRQDSEKQSRVQQDMYARGMETAAQIARDVAQASHQNVTQAAPIIITPGMAPASMAPSAGGGQPPSQAEKNCPDCGRKVADGARFCPHCGKKFEGV